MTEEASIAKLFDTTDKLVSSVVALSTTQKAMTGQLKDIHTFIVGNGGPGIKTQVAVLENDVCDNKDAIKQVAQDSRYGDKIIMGVIVLIVAIAGVVVKFA